MVATIVGGAVRRPFSSWRTPYREGNSSLGFFCDLVVEAHHPSPTVFLKEIGLNHRTIDPRKVLSSLLLLPLKAVDREALDRASAFVKATEVRLSGEVLRPRHWSITQRRWCPACLAESPHHRTWWDVLPYVECHLHGCPLEDADAEGRPVEWWWPHMAESPRGHRLARAGSRLARPPLTLSSYIVGRLGYSGTIPVPLLDGAPLGEALNFVRIAGRILDWHRVPVPSTAEFASRATGDAFEACAAGGEVLIEGFRRVLIERVRAEERMRGLRCLGWVQFAGRELNDEGLRNLLGDSLRGALARVGVVGGKGARGPRRAAAGSRFVGLFDLSARLGLDRRGVLALAGAVGVMPERKWDKARLDFDATAVGAITLALEGLLTEGDAARELRLSPAALGGLAAAGTLKPLVSVSRGQAPGRRYLRDDVERVRLAIEAGRSVPGLVRKDHRRLPAHKRATGTYRDLGTPGPIGMCRAEVQAELGVSVETVGVLERLGMLSLLPDAMITGARSLIDRDSVLEVAERLASARVYHGVVGATAAKVVERLAEYGLRPVVEPTPDGRTTPMFDRAAVRLALGLERDPDAPGADRVDGLWHGLHAALLVACPRLKCPARMPADAFTVHTGNRRVTFTVRVDRAAQEILIGVPISRGGSARRWNFFEANRAEVLGVSDSVRWQESMNEVEGRIGIGGTGDVAGAAAALGRLTKLLGATSARAMGCRTDGHGGRVPALGLPGVG